ncbi:unnamed protein product, partial [Heterobilharzia americana]
IEKGENIEEKTIEDCYMESLETEKCVDSKVAAEALKWISDVESFYNNSSQIPSKVASENVDIRHKDQESQTEVCQRKDDDCSLVFSVMIPVSILLRSNLSGGLSEVFGKANGHIQPTLRNWTLHTTDYQQP